MILNNQGTSTIAYAEVDLGHSDGPYRQLVNGKTDQVIGTGNKTNDANIGNADVPDVRLEAPGSAGNVDTQYWHLTTEPNGGVSLLNKSGGRAAAIWTGNATVEPEDRPVGRQQRHRQLEPRQDSRRVLQAPVRQEHRPVSDRRDRRSAADPADRAHGRFAGLGTRPVDNWNPGSGTRCRTPRFPSHDRTSADTSADTPNVRSGRSARPISSSTRMAGCEHRAR